MRRALSVIVGAFTALPASAGPWVREPGEGYARLALSHERLENLDGQRLDLYGEYGLTQDWTLTAKLEGVRYGEGFPSREGYRLTARRSLISWKNLRLAAEGGLVGGEALGGQGGCGTVGAELRLSSGGSLLIGERKSFVFVDIAQRQHEGCARSRLEAGLGTELSPRWSLTSQVWVEQASGDGASDSIKTEFALVRDLSRAELSLGWREEISSNFNEDAIVLAVAMRF